MRRPASTTSSSDAPSSFQREAGVQPPRQARHRRRQRRAAVLNMPVVEEAAASAAIAGVPGRHPPGDDSRVGQPKRRRHPGRPVRGRRDARSSARRGSATRGPAGSTRSSGAATAADTDLVRHAARGGLEASAAGRAGQLVGQAKRKGGRVVEFPRRRAARPHATERAVRPDAAPRSGSRTASSESGWPRSRRSTRRGATTSRTRRAPRSSSRVGGVAPASRGRALEASEQWGDTAGHEERRTVRPTSIGSRAA